MEDHQKLQQHLQLTPQVLWMLFVERRPSFSTANKRWKAYFNKYVLSSQFLVPRVLQECLAVSTLAFYTTQPPETSPSPEQLGDDCRERR